MTENKVQELALQLLKENRDAGCIGRFNSFVQIAAGALDLTGWKSVEVAREFIRKEGQVICLHRAADMLNS